MPGEMIHPRCPQPALGNLCECGPRRPLRRPGPSPSRETVRDGARCRGRRRGGVWRSPSARPPGAWAEDAAAAGGGQCTEGFGAPGHWGRRETRGRMAPGPADPVFAFGRPLVSSPKSCPLHPVREPKALSLPRCPPPPQLHPCMPCVSRGMSTPGSLAGGLRNKGAVTLFKIIILTSSARLRCRESWLRCLLCERKSPP